MDGTFVLPWPVVVEGANDEGARVPVGGDKAPLGEDDVVVPALMNALGATLGTFDGNPVVVPSSVSLFVDDSLLLLALLGTWLGILDGVVLGIMEGGML